MNGGRLDLRGSANSVGTDGTSALTSKDGLLAVIGESPTIRDIKAAVERVAVTDSTVLITGETGTGKELVATAIHHHSRRQHKPFIDINCAAIPDSLLESELFGYERGAFTGAYVAYEGKLRHANGGTIFFDEIGEMSPYAQAKMLRAFESRHVQSLGARKTYPIDVRVVAATNQNLEQSVADGRFRKDLYYRLDVTRIHLPALREHPEDIPALCTHYIQQHNREFGRTVQGFTDETLDCFRRYDWPGNVRELKNLIEALFVHCSGQQLSLSELPAPFHRCFTSNEQMVDAERGQILASLLATKWNKSQAAQKLHLSRVTLYRKMWKYRIVTKGETKRTAN